MLYTIIYNIALTLSLQRFRTIVTARGHIFQGTRLIGALFETLVWSETRAVRREHTRRIPHTNPASLHWYVLQLSSFAGLKQ